MDTVEKDVDDEFAVLVRDRLAAPEAGDLRAFPGRGELVLRYAFPTCRDVCGHHAAQMANLVEGVGELQYEERLGELQYDERPGDQVQRKHANSRKIQSFALGLLLLAGLVHPFIYWSLFTGDGEIHLLYADNLLRGRMLQFNLGEPNSGETSMGFMLLDAVFLKLFGGVWAPIAIKIVCLLSLYVTAFATWLIGGRLGVNRPYRELAALALLFIPGIAYSSMLGTENVLFAALSSLFFYWTVRIGWYSNCLYPSVSQDALAGLMAGGLFWLRPETAPLLLMFLTVRFAGAVWFRRSIRQEIYRQLVVGTIFMIAVGIYYAVFIRYAHELPYGAGKARKILSMLAESSRIGPFFVNYKVLIRLVSYFSIVLPALGAVAIALRPGGWGLQRDRSLRLTIIAAALPFFGFMAAYVLNWLPAFHFARYSIFVWPYGLVLAAVGVQAMVRSEKFNPRLIVACGAAIAIGFSGTVLYESYLRREMIPNKSLLNEVQGAPGNREAFTRKIERQIGLQPGDHATLAFQEVQYRYRLDDNLVIRSLDGITDSRLINYVCDGWIDHDGYLIDTGVDFVMEFPNYNQDRSAWSLADLGGIDVGQSVRRPGITYTKITPQVAKVDRTVQNSADRPNGRCGAKN